MISHERLYLIGMPASGKSTWGRQLALAWRWQFLDMDADIEAHTRLRIPQLFKQHGEDYFREREREALHRTQNYTRTVIATGGGAPCFFDNMSVINQLGVSVFLDVPLEELLERLSKRGNNRPLFADRGKLYEQVQATYAARIAYYEQAHLRVQASRFPLLRLADKIRMWEYNQSRQR